MIISIKMINIQTYHKKNLKKDLNKLLLINILFEFEITFFKHVIFFQKKKNKFYKSNFHFSQSGPQEKKNLYQPLVLIKFNWAIYYIFPPNFFV